MAAQAISAVIQVGQGVSPAQFGFSPAQATQAGLTISSGLTPAFWIYCVFLVALIASATWMLLTPAPAAAGPARQQAGGLRAPGAPHAPLAAGAPQPAGTRPLAAPPAAAETQPQSAEAPNAPRR
jgi:hypothetical protein